MTERHTMKEVDHSSPFADELTSVWHRGEGERIEETDGAPEATEADDREPVRMPADD